AQFLGSPKMNVFDAVPTSCGVRIAGSGMLALPNAAAGVAKVGARPENITVAAAGQGNIDGKVDVVERLGSDTYAYIALGNGELVTVRLPGNARLVVGETVGLVLDIGELHLFDAEGKTLAAAR
ncbi:MAG: TOBE domain-containing protein, partial [Rhizobiaceae bacterium]|nr:TOBE domain-containing protein [Rhizobiaceae bacterium]